MRFGVVVFPGSNCDYDCYYVLSQVLEVDTVFIWHGDKDLKDCDCIVLPGGFSYGDYLRAGAIARFSPVMEAVKEFAEDGGLVIGICNGFQVLTEAGILPGALLPNKGGRFICRQTYLRVENNQTPFTLLFTPGEVVKIPIAHQQGNFFIDPLYQEEIKKQIAFRYCSSQGEVDANHNPNGSWENVAGIISKEGNILGMMPHPERAAEKILGSEDGRRVFLSVIKWWEEKRWK
ncbi:MAG: phosphoribosylformylglycinamidine synthase subunit PurQ / glutaminase [Candidatus Atribacteria bacterium]|nr:phosphoribosylformylglycinamidine synthase subunit PurQ / glutaminase [Candidatus Atribacteria bacterium]